ncbi:MAG TPA: response regulator, partial [Gemmataceae bacterium]|nr:response regulator [Gemmataceae bacterium]
MARILLIDDDPDLTYILREDLARHGHQVDCLDSAERGPEMLVDRAFDLVLLDNFMPKMSGIEFLSALQQRGVDVPVILMTQLGSADTAIQAMRFGAYDYVIKPREHQGLFPLLQPIIARALAPTPPLADHPPPEPPPRPSAGPMLVGSKSKSMVAVYMQIGRLARGDTAVLILGETGTGKELVARAIHSHSPRMARRFVALDCTDLSENLLDGELFGHDGTLFLDEIGD